MPPPRHPQVPGSGPRALVPRLFRAFLVRWSLEQSKQHGGVEPNSRFIILDPNGEYSRAFDETGTLTARIFKVDPNTDETSLKVPLWFWTGAEWCAFTQASARAQRPTLLHALRFARDGVAEPSADSAHEMRRYLRTLVATIRIELHSGSPWGSFPKPKSFFDKLAKWKSSLEAEPANFSADQNDKRQSLIDYIDELCRPRRVRYPDWDFTREEVKGLLDAASAAHSAFGGSQHDVVPSDIDSPRPFDATSFLRSVEATAEMLNVSEYVETLIIRLRALLSDANMKPIMGAVDDMKLAQWLEEYIGSDDKDDSSITIIDLSLVPSDVVHIITAVIARMTFEALQHYVKLNGVSLPTVLVMEEAHNFIKSYRDDIENQDTAAICCQVFERIAREGRKFGLGLVLSSQRPSELSPAVLSQCNTFLLHRITNDRDQDLVQRLVPDNLMRSST